MAVNRRTENKIVLVRRKTRLEELVARHNTVEQARFYIEHLGSDFSDYLEEDRRYRATLAEAGRVLATLGRVQLVERGQLPNLIFGREDTVVAVGQDGLVANTMKYLDGQPLVGVNPDPARWDGVLLPFAVEDLDSLLPELFAGRRPLREVSMAKASLEDGQVLYAVNDLFIGQRSHVSSRYHLRHGEQGEDQSSSGIIVSTGLGATGWLKSIVAGARGVMATLGLDRELPFQPPDWDADYLQYTVREPFPSRSSAATLVFGRVCDGQPLRIVSQMPENGVIFSDGVESDFLEFPSGMEARIAVAEKRGHLVL